MHLEILLLTLSNLYDNHIGGLVHFQSSTRRDTAIDPDDTNAMNATSILVMYWVIIGKRIKG